MFCVVHESICLSLELLCDCAGSRLVASSVDVIVSVTTPDTHSLGGKLRDAVLDMELGMAETAVIVPV